MPTIKPEIINGLKIRVYDAIAKYPNDGYSVYILNQAYKDRHYYTCLCMNRIGMFAHESGMLGRHNGKVISFYDLPAECQQSFLKVYGTAG